MIGKPKPHHGDTEKKNLLPQIYADEAQIRRRLPKSPKARFNTFETQTNGGSGEEQTLSRRLCGWVKRVLCRSAYRLRASLLQMERSNSSGSSIGRFLSAFPGFLT